MPASPRRLDRRHDLLGILGSEQAVLAGVRVDPAHRDPRRFDEAVQRLVGQLDHLRDPRRRDPTDRLLQRHVGADVGDGEVTGRQHHRVALNATRARRSTRCDPTNNGSLSCVASLFIGIVTMPATRPAKASAVAASTYCRAAAPDAASMTPGR